MTLELCTVYKGVPYGLAIIKYSHPDNIGLSFRGIGVLNQGKLSNSSFNCIMGSGTGFHFANMENGRPADKSYASIFNPRGHKQNSYLLKKEIDDSGWQFYSG